MNIDKKISVIVPVYNAESYLSQCIESILKQDYNDIEVLLVDDGSSDNSAQICEEYRSRYSKIKVFLQKNSGVSSARNKGIQYARGDYIVFVDADDYLPESYVLSHMMAAIGDADILVGNYMRLWNGNLLPAKSCSDFSGFPREEATFRFRGFFSVGTLSYVWCKMYRRYFLLENQLRFENYAYAEDKLFNCFCYIRRCKYAFLPETVYVYRKNDASVSHQFRPDSVWEWMSVAEKLEHFAEENARDKEYEDLIACTIFFAAFFDGKMNYVYSGKTLSAVKKVLKQYASYPLAKKYFSMIVRGKLSKNIPSFLWKIMIWGFAWGMWLHCYGLLSFGIKILIDWRIDERLSKTGLKPDEQALNPGCNR